MSGSQILQIADNQIYVVGTLLGGLAVQYHRVMMMIITAANQRNYSEALNILSLIETELITMFDKVWALGLKMTLTFNLSSGIKYYVSLIYFKLIDAHAKI